VRETEELLTHQHVTPVDVCVWMSHVDRASGDRAGITNLFARYPDIELALVSSERQADLVEDIDCAIWSGEILEPELRRTAGGFSGLPPVLRPLTSRAWTTGIR
jgi:hypothetical protein